MPGFYDPVSATFVQSVIQLAGGYTLFHDTPLQVFYRAQTGSWIASANDVCSGLAKIPRSIVMLSEIAMSAPVTGSCEVQLLTAKQGASMDTIHKVSAPNVTVKGFSTYSHRTQVRTVNIANGQIDIQAIFNTTGSNPTISYWLYRIGVIY